MSKRIIYQVLVRAYGNGRFSAWNKAAFRRLKKMGVSDIWFTGIPRHASGRSFIKGNLGSPYAICDWYDVNPYLADNPDNRMEEFKELILKAHKEGFRVITDFIPNHVARNYCDCNGGIPVTGYCDYDWTDTYKIDYSVPSAVTKMKDIALFWAGMGVDGFRFDMAEMVEPGILGQITAAVKKFKPDFTMIAEIYNTANYRRYLYEAGFDILYDKSGIYDILHGILCNGRSAEALTGNWQFLGDIQDNMLNFLENHDEVRIASSSYLCDGRKAFAALGAAALFSRASFMFYCGQECGERASEEANGRTSIFNKTHINSLDNPDRTILRKYKTILKLASSPICCEGDNWDLCYCQNSSSQKGLQFDKTRHFAFLRHLGGQTLLVVCNFSKDSGNLIINIADEAAKQFNLRKTKVKVKINPFDCSLYFI